MQEFQSLYLEFNFNYKIENTYYGRLFIIINYKSIIIYHLSIINYQLYINLILSIKFIKKCIHIYGHLKFNF